MPRHKISASISRNIALSVVGSATVAFGVSQFVYLIIGESSQFVKSIIGLCLFVIFSSVSIIWLIWFDPQSSEEINSVLREDRRQAKIVVQEITAGDSAAIILYKITQLAELVVAELLSSGKYLYSKEYSGYFKEYSGYFYCLYENNHELNQNTEGYFYYCIYFNDADTRHCEIQLWWERRGDRILHRRRGNQGINDRFDRYRIALAQRFKQTKSPAGCPIVVSLDRGDLVIKVQHHVPDLRDAAPKLKADLVFLIEEIEPVVVATIKAG